jgi:uncharacterized protein (DUF1015 family)
MAEIAPLTPLRYDLAKLPSGLAPVVAPPYDVIDAKMRAELAARHPHNIVQLDLPEGEGDAKYERAAKVLAEWLAAGVLVRDEEPAFYAYAQTFTPPGGGAPITRRGFLGLARLAPFSEKIILPHERTLSGPKEDRLKLSRATHAALSPGFLLYRDPKNDLAAILSSAATLADFTTPDGVRQVLGKITDADAMRAIESVVARSSLLIADGHHRYETALRYAGEVASVHPDASPRGEHNYYLAFFANGDDPDLVVFPTHRHVHSLPRFDYDDLLERAGALFTITRRTDAADGAALADWLRGEKSKRPAFVVAAPDGRAALLVLEEGADLAAHPTLGKIHPALRTTDVAVLHSGILEHLLGITPEAQAAKTNIWYPQDARAATSDLRAGKGQALFLMNGTPVADVRRVAEAGEVMPQKSTFFYPKVLTGLVIHTLQPQRRVAAP